MFLFTMSNLFEQETEKLWKNFQLDFQLEASKFPDNKIYGTIDIKPESARKLIRKLVVSYLK